jgi:hypothetical protein
MVRVRTEAVVVVWVSTGRAGCAQDSRARPSLSSRDAAAAAEAPTAMEKLRIVMLGFGTS